MSKLVPTAWLNQQWAWKGKQIGQVGVYFDHVLVLVGHGGAHGHEVLALLEAITQDVHMYTR